MWRVNLVLVEITLYFHIRTTHSVSLFVCLCLSVHPALFLQNTHKKEQCIRNVHF
jgi:hypothetical protein